MVSHLRRYAIQTWNVCLVMFSPQRQSKLDEVTGKTGESDGLGGVPSIPRPLTTPLERRDIPPQLSMTLEHIVGQLDVLTQVCVIMK